MPQRVVVGLWPDTTLWMLIAKRAHDEPVETEARDAQRGPLECVCPAGPG